VGFAFFAGTWVYTTYYLRYLVPVLFLAVLLYSYRRIGIPGDANRAKLRLPAAIACVFGVLTGLAVASRHDAESIALSFPLRSGTYHVLQGGSSVVTNPLHALVGTPLALDIVKLNAFGGRATWFAPRELAAYAIFGEPLYSPCAGSVVAAHDGVADRIPGEPQIEHTVGNHVRLRCGDAQVVMEHMMRGSVQISPGQILQAGQPLGRVGNSGHTLEPHLHIEARRGGRPIAISFDGEQLSMNAIVRRPDR
jgi:peptidase M23-like protein